MTDAGLEYAMEAAKERKELAAAELVEDLQEANSIRYGVWVRVAVLSSGRWAVYHDSEPETGAKETGVIEVFEALDPEYLRTLSINEQAKAEERHQAHRIRLDSEEGSIRLEQKATKTLEDMGL